MTDHIEALENEVRLPSSPPPITKWAPDLFLTFPWACWAGT